MAFYRRCLFLFLLICLGCSAQSLSPDVSQRIERQVRSYYNLPPSVNVSISSVGPSEFPEYNSLTITIAGPEKKQDYPFLLSKNAKTLIRMTKLDLTKDPYAETMSKITTAGRPTRGNKNAKVVLVNFDDFECPFCSRIHQTLFPEILKEYGDRVEFIYKDFPLAEIHPWATHAAVDANCLLAQNNDAYWDFADYIHSNQREVSSQSNREAQFGELDKLTFDQGKKHNLDATKLQACVKTQNDDAVKASVHEGEILGISATPTMFVNGQQLDGAVPMSELRATLDRALQDAGVPVPAHPPATPQDGDSHQPSE